MAVLQSFPSDRSFNFSRSLRRVSYLSPAFFKKDFNFFALTKEFISKTSLKACFCHAGLSGIFLQEGFPTSGNDIQVALLMTVLVYLLNHPEIEEKIPDNA